MWFWFSMQPSLNNLQSHCSSYGVVGASSLCPSLTTCPFCRILSSEGKFFLPFLPPSIFHWSHTRVFGGGETSPIGATRPGFPSSTTSSINPYSFASQAFIKLSRSVSTSICKTNMIRRIRKARVRRGRGFLEALIANLWFRLAGDSW